MKVCYPGCAIAQDRTLLVHSSDLAILKLICGANECLHCIVPVYLEVPKIIVSPGFYNVIFAHINRLGLVRSSSLRVFWFKEAILVR